MSTQDVKKVDLMDMIRYRDKIETEAAIVWKDKTFIDPIDTKDIKIDGLTDEEVFKIMWSYGLIYEIKLGQYGYTLGIY